MPANKDHEIYRAYTEAKADPKKKIGDVFKRFGISRGQLYEVIRRVEQGNPARIERDTEKGRLAALWEHKYKARFLALAKDRRPATIAELRSIIRGMDKDGFPQTRIATLLKKERSTIIHHLQLA